MTKEEIVEKIKQIAIANGGKPPGQEKFRTETGITRRSWSPKYWIRWSDALEEAGFKSNSMSKAYDKQSLILHLIDVIREFEHFPSDTELRYFGQNQEGFPSHGSFRRLGIKIDRVKATLDFCNRKKEYDDIAEICSAELSKTRKRKPVKLDEENETVVGYVYLLQHGNRNEYKIGRTNNPIRREGEIRLELPEKVKPVHYIETDDPSGVENYWHNRFKGKRKEGEWFSLTDNDVRAFKRWKRIY